MSAAGIKGTTTTNKAAGIHESGMKKNHENNENETDCAPIPADNQEISSFSELPTSKERQTTLYRDPDLQDTVPLEKSKQNAQHLPESEADKSQVLASSRHLDDFPKSQLRQNDVDATTSELCPGLSLLQQTAAASSPPPHSYRHSRAYRHFKNPPQPHMCIRTTTEAGEELFINVLSWTRIVIPQEPSDPIPLYGGMRVPPGSPRSPAIVFAVMANPEVLKDSGRHSKDPEERRAMVELMCDFVEAMNPGVKLVRNAVILKDRDISGELKDVWNAVQAQRDREREEQMLLQRQQHQLNFHNLSNANTNGASIPTSSLNAGNNPAAAAVTATPQKVFSKPAILNESIITTTIDSTPQSSRKNIPEVQNVITSNIDIERDIDTTKTTNNDQVSLNVLNEHLNNKISAVAKTNEQTTQNTQNAITKDALNNANNSNDILVKVEKRDINNQSVVLNNKKDVKKEQQANGFASNCHNTDLTNASKIFDSPLNQNTTITPTPAQQTNITLPSTAPVKKEKLGGFLPNGCIFPRFTKNNKHKDKEKDKEPKTKEKEKNALLSALKKSKDKKPNAAANSDDKNTSSNSKLTANNCNISNTKQQKNCLQPLESGVQKIDLNNHHNTNIGENNSNNSIPILSNNSTSETNKNTTSTIKNSDGVGVH